MANGEGNAFIMKNSHALLIVASWVILTAMAFATLRAESDENRRLILEQQQRPNVTLPQYEDGQQMLKERLDSIDRRLQTLEQQHH